MISRRQFMKACCFTGVAASSYAMPNFLRFAQATNSYTKKITADDYKALVCVFLFGGNDAINTVMPINAGYQSYQSMRQDLTIAEENILAVGAGDYGFHPSMVEMQDLFNNNQRLAVLANVGPLIRPLTKNEVAIGMDIPPQLRAHDLQQRTWQLNNASGTGTGWSGLVTDILAQQNTYPYLSNISLLGSNVFQTGVETTPFALSSEGYLARTQLADTNGALRDAYLALVGAQQNHIFERAYAGVEQKALATYDLLQGLSDVTTVFPNTSLAKQLQGVARLIKGRTILGATRQTFYVGIGGFDTHTSQLNQHAGLLQQLSQALSAFYSATEELNVANQVTTFTMSDFGRGLQLNSNIGTDHGWGGHHFVLGGAVNGGHIYGNMPSLELGGDDDSGAGFIPTTATDQYAATLARWFGMGDTEISAIFPNINNFSTDDLGFFA